MELTLIPESAPFNAEQRAWLNGFLSGWLGLQNGAASQTVATLTGTSSTSLAGSTSAPVAHTDAEDFPWHDPSLPIDERMRLAEGKPKERRMMAAMAQLDCGACGYLCRTYSEAIARGEETSLTLCSPGGSETAKMLKRILKEQGPGTTRSVVANGVAQKGAATPSSNGVARNGTADPSSNGWSRKNPFTARVLRGVNLNKPGSDKQTHHIEIELGDHGPSYQVGDSLGISPENCGALVDELIVALGTTGDEPVATSSGAETSLRDALARHCCLATPTEDLLELLSRESADAGEPEAIRRLIDDDGPITGFDVLDVLRRFPAARPSPTDFVRSLAELKPRLYSIASSPKRHPGQVHLTVRRVSYAFNNRIRKGVASTMLADRVAPGTPIRVFVQKSHGFTLPPDPETPLIMIGPGTGIAPFRAFLHEREVIGATGKSWLFFGDQRSTHDFLYEDELRNFLGRGVLTCLHTAFSRDQDQKVYVQHRITEHGQELFHWLEDGASICICGDAKRMAADVDRALQEVVQMHGGRCADAAKTYLAELATSGRYCRDVY